MIYWLAMPNCYVWKIKCTLSFQTPVEVILKTDYLLDL